MGSQWFLHLGLRGISIATAKQSLETLWLGSTAGNKGVNELVQTTGLVVMDDYKRYLAENILSEDKVVSSMPTFQAFAS